MDFVNYLIVGLLVVGVFLFVVGMLGGDDGGEILASLFGLLKVLSGLLFLVGVFSFLWC